MTTPLPPHNGPLLDVRELRVSFRTPDGILEAVRGISFSADPAVIAAVPSGAVLGTDVGASLTLHTGRLRYAGHDPSPP